MMNEALFVKIDDYLHNRLEEEEKLAFEKKLRSDPSLMELVDWQQETNAFLKRQAFLENLSEIDAKWKTTPLEVTSKQTTRRLRPAWIGVAMAAALALGIVFWQSSDSFSYEHPPLALTEQSVDGQDFSAAEVAFNRGDYAKALPLLEDYLASKPTDKLVQFYRGIALMEVGEYTTAEQIFTSLVEGETVLKTDGIWYSALLRLKQNREVEALEYLNEIDMNSYYYSNAQDLILKLKK